MTLKIEKASEGKKIILRLSGRLQSALLPELKRQLQAAGETSVLDFKEVTLVDLEVVQFLGFCAGKGMELRNCASYIREWILREQRCCNLRNNPEEEGGYVDR
jgi:hypothetical protein